MKKLLFGLLLGTCFVQAQVTLRITSIPSNTPNNATIYVAGSINNWDPASANDVLQSDGLGALLITIPEGTGTVEYKFTRGSWPSVEGNATGGYLPNRTFTFTGSPQVINLTIQSWEDIAGSGSNSTAAANVQILSPSFFIPQLNTTRRVWIYLPPDYYTTTKTYPVLYMQDGQNLFDAVTSPFGEWQIDESLNQLHSQGNYGVIVVGIDNGGASRSNEYSPWVNAQNVGGQGDQYMQFVGETLKPFVDTNFRTKPQSQFNALIGSSMGAFIATYGAVKYPNLFSKVGVFSPSFWFALTEMNEYINTTTNDLSNQRLYFVAGENETTTMVPNLNIIRTKLITKGVATANTFTKIDSFGTHSESYWRGEFAAAYLWLFANENLAVSENNIQFKAFQVQDKFFIEGLLVPEKATIYTVSGQKCKDVEMRNGYNELPNGFSKGIYILKIGEKHIKIVI